MKKILYTIALMLVALSSCGDKLGNKEMKQVERQSTVTYTINSSQDLIDAIDLVVTYKGKGGINVSDTISDTVWTKTVVNDMVPVKVGLSWSVLPKVDSKISKDSLDLRATYVIECNEVTDTMNEWLDFIWLKKFPASKLGALCDLENHKQDYARTKGGPYETPCFIIAPEMIGDGLKYDWAQWRD